jgi:hypothetical protein
MAFGLTHLRRAVVRPQAGLRSDVPGSNFAGSRALAAMWLACIAGFLVIAVDERDLSLYKPLFEYVPGINSIRAPFRVQAFEYAVAMVVLLRTIEMAAARRAGTRAVQRIIAVVAGAALCLLVAAEMVRPQGLSWSAEAFLRPGLTAQIPVVMAACDAVVVPVEPGADVILTQVDAVTLSSLTGLPTPQGYGRADPTGHPGNGAPAQAMADWMAANGFRGRVCSVTSAGVTPLTG